MGFIESCERFVLIRVESNGLSIAYTPLGRQYQFVHHTYIRPQHRHSCIMLRLQTFHPQSGITASKARKHLHKGLLLRRNSIRLHMDFTRNAQRMKASCA